MIEKTYDAAAIEPRIAARWEKANAFAAGASARPDAPAFSIVIPPPNVTGSLHMGHALNNTLQDILVRWHRMLGDNVLWQPGTDHAGIATQMVVERQLAERGEPARRELGREAFLEKVWAWKAESGTQISDQLRRMGASCDFSRERFTMDEGLSTAVVEVFVRLYEDGLIYRGKRLVNWDPHFETAISDLEVENREVEGHMWHFKYPLADGATYDYVEKDEDGNVTLTETRDYISIATTRPETMLGDGAVAVHPDDERYAPIIGKLCEIPVGPKEHRRLIPIITDDYPDPEFGSGAVKITGAHDFNDYAVAQRGDIPMYRLMDTKAAMRADGAPYATAAAQAVEIARSGVTPDEDAVDAINLVPDELRGLDRYEARRLVVEQITAEGLAVMVPETDPRLGPVTAPVAPEEGGEVRAEVPLVEKNVMQQPFGDRSGTVIEPMLTDQWFADAATLAKPAIEAVRSGRTQFVPASWDKTYFNWMENIEPWCISRQLWWGHRIPAWYGPDGRIFVARDETQARVLARGHYGRDEALTRDEDVLDTWFSSALWPFSTMGWPDETPELAAYYPTSVLSTAFDIIFFWVARMMMMGLHFTREVPFHTVYIHPLVRAKDGQKMSKSKGNGIDPRDLFDEYGADATRFTLASMATQGRDLKLDPARIAGYRNFGTKLWNATRFAQMNEARFSVASPSNVEGRINRWILDQLGQAVGEVDRALREYRFDGAANAAYRFTWNTFCDWYVELAKPALSGDDAAAREETRTVLGHVLTAIYRLLHPFMPFLTEELWAETESGAGLLCHARWPADIRTDDAAAAEIGWLIALISEVRSVRSEMGVKPGDRLGLVAVGVCADETARLARHDEALRRLARLDRVDHAPAAPSGAATVMVGTTTYALPLEGVIDFAAETARLRKEEKALEKEVRQLSGKLSNQKFLANAPDEVVEDNRRRLAEAETKASRIEQALRALG